jgi:hypothetical protein
MSIRVREYRYTSPSAFWIILPPERFFLAAGASSIDNVDNARVGTCYGGQKSKIFGGGAPRSAVEAATLAPNGSPPITRTTFPTCRAHYPGGSSGCACRLLPRSRPLSRGSNPCGYPHKLLVSYRINRQLSGWNLPPLMIRAFGAHCQDRTHALQQKRRRGPSTISQS